MSFQTPQHLYGVFPAGKVTERESIIRKCPHEFLVPLHEELIQSTHIPALGSAPLASWVIARLSSLDRAISPDGFRHNGYGGFQVDINVSWGIGVIAALLLDADMEQVSVIGRTIEQQYAIPSVECFVKALLDSPADVAECRYAVADPQWKTTPECFTPAPTPQFTNEYGWRRGKYLGEQNLRRRSPHGRTPLRFT
mgnify:CR=1 FL=1